MKTLIAVMVAALCLSTAAAHAATTSQVTRPAPAPRPLSSSVGLNRLHARTPPQSECGPRAIGVAWGPPAREFGSRMVEDQTAAEEKVRAVAKKLNITLTDPMDANLPAADQRELREDMMQLHALSQFEGLDFDRSYLTLMAAGNQKAIRLLEQAAASAQDPAVRDLAAQLLPAFQEHRTLAETALQAVAAPK